ncbi:MAG: hypothetical protein OSA98_10595 [Rubripirellula sp.]|nr:hypothetical protein [Rubripirellula sp.]
MTQQSRAKTRKYQLKGKFRREQLNRQTLLRDSGAALALPAIEVMATASLSNLRWTLLRVLAVPADRFSASNGDIKEILS